MTLMMKTILAGGAGLAALAAAAPAAAQYGYVQPYAQPYGYAQTYAQPYGYAQSYAQPYGYNNSLTAMATQRCSAAVQNRLSRRTSGGVSGIVGALLGANTSTGRVLSITQVTPRRGTIRVRGLATSGASRGYGPYGAGAYGALGYSYQPDLSFSCSVDTQGYVRNIDINRR